MDATDSDDVKSEGSTISQEETQGDVALVLDPATSTGYALVKIDEEDSTADIFLCDFLDVDATSNYSGDHCIDLMNQVKSLIDEHNVRHIAVEDYFFSKRFAVGCTMNVAYRTAIHILARQNSLEYVIMNVNAWKTFVAGRATPTREQKKLWGKKAKKYFIQQALWDRYGIRFPNHSISKTTGKPIALRYDVIDAVAQAVYYSKIIRGVKTVTISCEFPEDIPFKRKIKNAFEYDGSK